MPPREDWQILYPAKDSAQTDFRAMEFAEARVRLNA
jgi:hypothetical protein